MVLVKYCRMIYITIYGLGSACNEQNFENFTGGAVALLDYSDTECSVYDKVEVTMQSVGHFDQCD